MPGRKLIFLAMLAAIAAVAQTRVYVTAPQVRVTSGDTLQLSATARNAAGDIINNATFQWSSSNSSVAAVDSSGKITASALGLADIAAVYQGVSGILRVQVLPQRIDVTPKNISIPFGSQQQFTAVAYDSAGQAIPNVSFTWHLGIYNGGDSTTVSMRNGLVTATTLGYFIVRAAVLYPGTNEQFQIEFDGEAPVTIVPPNKYKLEGLASSNDAKPQFGLRGRRGSMAAANDGTLYFSGILDGLANGLMQISNGVISPVQLAGGPSFLPGVFIWDFDDPSVDSNGNVVARMANYGSGSMVVERTGDGAFLPIAMDGARAGGQELVNIYSNRYSLSDRGDVIFRADARTPGKNDNQQGFFRAAGSGFLVPEVSVTDKLDGFNGTVTSFDNQFGVDSAGAYYFIARGSTAVAYRKDLSGADPVKLLGLGDMVNGFPVNGIYQSTISRRGDVFLYGSTAGGLNYLAVFAGGKLPAKIFSGFSYISTIFDANATGSMVFTGDGGVGYGLYTWNPLQNGGSPQPLILRGRPLPGGEPLNDVYWAAIDANGRIYATVRGVDSPWLLIAVRPTLSVMAAPGDPIATSANVNLYPNIILGDKTGPLHMLAGGNQNSLFEVSKQGLKPFAVVNDKLPGGNLFAGVNPIRKSASGALYLGNDQAIYRSDLSSLTLIQPFPLVRDNVSTSAPYTMAVNDQNQFVTVSGSNVTGQPMLLFSPGSEPRRIAFFNGSGQYATPSPVGGTFGGVNDLAINESGIVMVNATVSGAQGGLFYYDGSQWQTLCQLQNCRFDGEPVTTINQLRASGNRFCAFFNNRLNVQSVRCWQDGSWSTALIRGEITSDGTELNAIGSYDINQKGDIAASLFTQGFGGPSIFLKGADGGYITVNAVLFPMFDGNTLRTVFSVDLRDDGRIFFTGMDYNDQVFVYEADPIQ